jgi:hypothetical protein
VVVYRCTKPVLTLSNVGVIAGLAGLFVGLIIAWCCVRRVKRAALLAPQRQGPAGLVRPEVAFELTPSSNTSSFTPLVEVDENTSSSNNNDTRDPYRSAPV